MFYFCVGYLSSNIVFAFPTGNIGIPSIVLCAIIVTIRDVKYQGVDLKRKVFTKVSIALIFFLLLMAIVNNLYFHFNLGHLS